MFVTMSEFHPMYNADWVNDMSEITIYLIRKIHEKEVFYLKEYNIQNNKAKWTKKFMSAHHFVEEGKAEEFISLYLPSRECDVYEHGAMWVI